MEDRDSNNGRRIQPIDRWKIDRALTHSDCTSAIGHLNNIGQYHMWLRELNHLKNCTKTCRWVFRSVRASSATADLSLSTYRQSWCSSCSEGKLGASCPGSRRKPMSMSNQLVSHLLAEGRRAPNPLPKRTEPERVERSAAWPERPFRAEARIEGIRSEASKPKVEWKAKGFKCTMYHCKHVCKS